MRYREIPSLKWMHAPIFAAFPILSLYLTNRIEVPLSAAAVLMLIGVGAAFGSLAVLVMICRNAERGGLMASVLVLAFFLYQTFSSGAFRLYQVAGRLDGAIGPILGLVAVTLFGFTIMRRIREARSPTSTRIFWKPLAFLSLIAVAMALLYYASRWMTFTEETWHRPALLLWGVSVIVILLGVSRPKLSTIETINAGVIRIAVILFLLPLAQWIFGTVQEIDPASASPGPSIRSEVPNASATGDADTPDIYHIILDAYGRADILENEYGIDNTPFLDALRARGFQVTDASVANYPKTVQTFASMFNMAYLQQFKREFRIDGRGKGRLRLRIQQNRVIDELRARGYRTYGFISGFDASDIMVLDERWGPKRNERRRFRELVLTLTPVADLRKFGLLLEDPLIARLRERTNFVVDHLAETAERPSPKFVLAHILPPHQPFVFGEDGKPRRFTESYWPSLAETEPGDTEGIRKYHEGYAAQLKGVNRMVLKALDELMAGMRPNSIIIIQGDHGPGSAINWKNAKRSNLEERFPVLNAMRFPGEAPESFRDDLSLIQTYVMILNEYFGTDYPWPETRSYFSIDEDLRFKYVDVTERVTRKHP